MEGLYTLNTGYRTNSAFSTSARTLGNGQSNVGLFRPMWKEALHGLLKEVR